MKWYDSIELDGKFQNDLSNAFNYYSGDIRQHHVFQRLVHQSRLGFMEPDGRHTIMHLEDDGMRKAGEAIGVTMFLALMEYNPTFVETLLKDMLTSHHQSMAFDPTAGYDEAITEAMGFTSKDDNAMTTPKNEDYEYWYDLSSSEDTIIIKCDLWSDDSSEFLKEIVFDMEDEEDKTNAFEEAEELVKGLYSGDVPLSRFVPEIPIEEAITKSSITDIMGSMGTPTSSTADYAYQSTPRVTSPNIQWKSQYAYTMPDPAKITKLIMS